MNFQGALTLLKEGKKLRRKAWFTAEYVSAPEEGTLIRVPPGTYVSSNVKLAISGSDGGSTAWRPAWTDLFADDWEIYQAAPSPVNLAGLTGSLSFNDGFFRWQDSTGAVTVTMRDLADALRHAKPQGAGNSVRRETDKPSTEGATCKD